MGGSGWFWGKRHRHRSSIIAVDADEPISNSRTGWALPYYVRLRRLRAPAHVRFRPAQARYMEVRASADDVVICWDITEIAVPLLCARVETSTSDPVR